VRLRGATQRIGSAALAVFGMGSVEPLNEDDD
jgi:hypothetical protein